MPWRPLPRIAFAVAVYPFQPSSPADLPLELGDELYIIEQGGASGGWYRGYLVAPPSLLAGLTSVKGQALEARVFSGIFPKVCVEVREVLGDAGSLKSKEGSVATGRRSDTPGRAGGDVRVANRVNGVEARRMSSKRRRLSWQSQDDVMVNGHTPSKVLGELPNGEERTRSPQAGQLELSRKSIQSDLPPTPVSLSPRDPDAPRPPAPVPMLKIGDETPTSQAEPLVDEIASCIREWHSTNLHQLLLGRHYDRLMELSELVHQLDLARRQLLYNVLTRKERETLREQTVWDLVRGNRMLSGEVIVRDPKQRGRLLTGDDCVVELTNLQSMMSLLDHSKTPQVEPGVLHHLLCEVRGVAGTASGEITLALSLYIKTVDGDFNQLSETYTIDIRSNESMQELARASKLKTLFTDLTANDTGEGSAPGSELYLVIKVQTTQVPKTSPSSLTKTNSREGASSRNGTHMDSMTPRGSVKSRRSLMWGKSPRAESSAGSETGGASPQTARSSTPKTATTENKTPVKTPAGKEPTVVRTVGVGVMDVGHILRRKTDAEHVFRVWSPTYDAEDEDAEQLEGWNSLVSKLMPSPTLRYTRSRHADRIHLHIYPFAGDDADELVKKTPTLMQGIVQSRKMRFSRAPTKPRSDIYVTLSKPALPPQILLSHPRAGHVQLGTDTGLANVQLTLEVRDIEGSRMEQAIFPSANSNGQTAWRTTAIERGDAWQQTIRLQIPADKVPGAHLIMSIADAPNFPFALSWMPLWEKGAFIRDGQHSLLLHQYDRSTSNTEDGRGAYLSLAWNAHGKDEMGKEQGAVGPLASLHLETYLCSTQYSQDESLLGLLHWRDSNPSRLIECLRRLTFVPEIEIVKLMADVFDALFGILVDNAGSEEYEDLIFHDLVTVLGIVHDRRFNLGPLVDVYADERFDFPDVAACILRSYLRLVYRAADPQASRNLRAAFKVGRHLLKFIVNARDRQRVREAGPGSNKTQMMFNRDMSSLFSSFETLMRNPAPALIGNRTLVVQHFHTWLPELSQIFRQEEISRIAVNFMDSCRDVHGKLILYKLVLLQNYTNLECFQSSEANRDLVLNTVKWLAPYWGLTDDPTEQWREQVRLCCGVLSTQIQNRDHSLGSEFYNFMPKIVGSYCSISEVGVTEKTTLSTLFSKQYPFQVRPIPTPTRFDEALVELAAVMAAVTKMPFPSTKSLQGTDVEGFLLQALRAHMSVLSCEAYPKTWLSIHIYHHQSTMKSLEFVSSMLMESYIPPPEEADDFHTDLWKAFFATLLKLVSSDVLALETYPEQKRRAVWKIAGDVRESGAEMLRRTWEAIGWDTSPEDRSRFGLEKLGGFQVQYVPSLVSPIMKLCLSVHEGLRHVAVEVLQTMILSEWSLNEDLSVIEAEMIDSLDQLFKSKHLNESIVQKLFIGELIDLFEPLSNSADESLWTALKELVGTIDELLDLLVAAHGGDATETFQIMHTLRLMEFMKDMRKDDIYIKYIHDLARWQAGLRNPTQAGLALKLHADLYEWDTSTVLRASSSPLMPEQTMFDRKEALYFEMIQYFEDGQAWLNALTSYKELAFQYEHETLDFGKLARTQRAMARIHESIVKEDRQSPRYFHVLFKGLGFPPGLRDKQFIFEASPSERLAAFTDRMQKQHPAAQFVAPSEVDNLEGQFLHITSVSPHRDLEHHVYQRSRVPHNVREHMLVSEPFQFSVTSKRQGSVNNLKEQWVEKTVYTIAEPFPTILRRSEIVAEEEIRLSPVQTAIERTWRKTYELATVEKRFASGEDQNLSPLTEVLIASVEAQSPTCVASYRQLLPEEHAPTTNGNNHDHDDEDEQEEEEEKPAPKLSPTENALRIALIDHALMIKRCLQLYSRSAHQATRIDLAQRFESTFAPEIAFSASPDAARNATPPFLASPTRLVNSRASASDRLSTPRGTAFPPDPTISSSNHPSTSFQSAKPSSSSHQSRLSLNFLKRSASSHPTINIEPAPSESKPNGTIPEERSSRNTLDLDRNDDASSSHRRSRSLASDKRRSVFHLHSDDRANHNHSISQSNSNSNSKREDSSRSLSVASEDRSSSAAGDVSPGGTQKTGGSGGSVRKRLSLLNMGGIGRKKSKGNVGGGEEM